MAGEWDRLNEIIQTKRNLKTLYEESPSAVRSQQHKMSMADDFGKKLGTTYSNDQLNTLFKQFKNYSDYITIE